MLQVDEHQHVETVVPLCPWCEKPLDGIIINGLHEKCSEEFGEEWEKYDVS
jgi:hypothetical protein